ncbi:hypothetical protein SAMN06265171_102425 [Chryseobacterium rhizoplanae]|uniref:Uncharacterized protein n=1 Tax=Chryseobacterium rhizoplanae TaxID=1609531 RepID=A0A521C464_9FLAO|nr:hypothetical protein [Chryseobacterium rhizoplanae]SMO54135.1 hypothetical protein SAMN06265171_102425 [Chryseobacterium rhizoplanae]
MTYEETLNLKIEAEKTIMETGYLYKYLIVPEIEEERIKFFESYNEKKYTDEDCKKYSSNKEYLVWQTLTDESIERIIKESRRRFQ